MANSFSHEVAKSKKAKVSKPRKPRKQRTASAKLIAADKVFVVSSSDESDEVPLAFDGEGDGDGPLGNMNSLPADRTPPLSVTTEDDIADDADGAQSNPARCMLSQRTEGDRPQAARNTAGDELDDESDGGGDESDGDASLDGESDVDDEAMLEHEEALAAAAGEHTTDEVGAACSLIFILLRYVAAEPSC